MEHEKFKLKSLDQLRELIDKLGVDIPVTDDLSVLFDEVEIAGHKLKNRIVSMPMEGIDAGLHGGPSDYTFRRYERFAAGGSSLLWAEACAVAPEGRSNPRQLLITPENLEHYKRFIDQTKAASRKADGKDTVIILQLTHSGRFSKPSGKPTPIFAQRNPEIDAIQNLDPSLQPVTDDQLERLIEDFGKAAKLAEQAGFDGVDMKAVHGYLIAELLGARMRENSRFGGSYENRTRFIKDALKHMQSELSSAFVCSRITAYEPSVYPYGWGVEEVEGSNNINLEEPIRLLKELKDLGLPLAGLSLGYPRTQPHWNRPHDIPLAGDPTPPEHPLVGVARFMEVTRKVQHAVPDLAIASAGLSWARHFVPNIGAAQIQRGDATLFGMGRGLLAYPDMPMDLKNEGIANPKKACIACSKCSQIMADIVCRSGCVIRDKEIYKDEYLVGRKVAKSN